MISGEEREMVLQAMGRWLAKVGSPGAVSGEREAKEFIFWTGYSDHTGKESENQGFRREKSGCPRLLIAEKAIIIEPKSDEENYGVGHFQLPRL